MSITVIPSIGSALQLYKYEPFSYRFTYSPGATCNASTIASSSPVLTPFLTADTSGVTFAAPSGIMGATSLLGEVLYIIDSLSNTYSANIVIGAGRFFPPASGASYTFYANETITPIQFDSSANLAASTLFTQPSLPGGFSFTASTSNRFFLSGRGSLPIARATYLFVGSNASNQIATTKISFQVLPERVQLIGGPITRQLTIGSAITPAIITATVPTNAAGTMNYTFSSLPSGLSFRDSLGATVSSPFYPTDANLSLVLDGTPTIATATSLAAVGTNSFVTSIAARAVGSSVLSNSTTATFSYSPTVLFTTPSDGAVLSNLTATVRVPSTGYRFIASTFFSSSSPITSIFSPNLRSDLSLNYNVAGRYADLSGTPLTAGTGSYTIRASNAAGLTGDIQVTIPVTEDVVTLSPPVDACMNFVVGRPVSNALAGYYSANPSLFATSSGNLPITITSAQLLATGISLTTVGGTAVFTGIPTTVTPLTYMVFTATDGIASNTVSVPIQVVDDSFTWGAVASPTFRQNTTVTPIQLSATTLSGRSIASFGTTGLPTGLVCSASGYIQGTCLSSASGTISLSASTGYSTGTSNLAFTTVADNILFTTVDSNWTLTPGATIPPIQISAVAYSGQPITSYSVTSPGYGFTISPSALLGGTLYTGYPPQLLYSNSTLTVSGTVGAVSVPFTFTLNTCNALNNRSFTTGNVVVEVNGTPGYYLSILYKDTVSGQSLVPTYQTLYSSPNQSIDYQTYPARFLVSKFSNTYKNNVFLTADLGPGGNIIRSTDGQTFSNITWGGGTSFMYSMSYASNSTWYGVAATDATLSNLSLFTTADDGLTWSGTSLPYLYGQQLNTSNIIYTPFYLIGSNTGPALVRPSGPYLVVGGGANYTTSDGINFARSATMFIITNPSDPVGTAYTCVNYFQSEVQDMNFDGPVGIAVGSDWYTLSVYTTPISNWPPPPNNTLLFSTDRGYSWNECDNMFTAIGTEVIYGNNMWLAAGIDGIRDSTYPTGSYKYLLKYSSNGTSWSNVAMPSVSPFPLSGGSYTGIAYRLNSLRFNGASWEVLLTNDSNQTAFYLTHSATTSFDVGSNWSLSTVSAPATAIAQLAGPLYTDAASTTLTTTLTNTTGTTGITFTNASTSFAYLQYVPIAPVVVTTTPSSVYLYVDNTTLPRGMLFNAATRTFSGTPVIAGNYITRVYAQDSSNNVVSQDFNFIVQIPDVKNKQQISAAAFTSLVRQEVEIDGAQYARDTLANPVQAVGVGALMSPAPPTVTTATIPQNCTKTC